MNQIDSPPDENRCGGLERGQPRRASTCPRCGAASGCGVDSLACWCTRLPPIDPARLAAQNAAGRAPGLSQGSMRADCLCPDCLALLTAKKGDK